MKYSELVFDIYRYIERCITINHYFEFIHLNSNNCLLKKASREYHSLNKESIYSKLKSISIKNRNGTVVQCNPMFKNDEAILAKLSMRRFKSSKGEKISLDIKKPLIISLPEIIEEVHILYDYDAE